MNQIHHQTGPENNEFVQLLSRLQEGHCNSADYQLLKTQIITNTNENSNSPKWKNAQLIVTDNTSKDAVNNKAALAFAADTGNELHWYYASDRKSQNEITDAALLAKLQKLHSGQTQQCLGKIPLVLGMPVMITQNFDVEAGIVNGSKGFVKKIRYYIDRDGNRHLTSCIVHVKDTSDDPLQYLAPHNVAVLSDMVDLHFTHPFQKIMHNLKNPSSHSACICYDHTQGTRSIPR